MTSSEPHDESVAGSETTIDQLVEIFTAELRAGESPSIAAFQQRYPHLAHEIEVLFPSLQMLEGCRPDEQAGPRIAIDDAIGDHLGDYRLIGEIGRGGMGVVYEAEHIQMRRRVALKVLPRSQNSNPSAVARFQQEARSAGQLHHTNIVPVFEVGEDDGFYFYSMQFIRGQNLDAVIDEVKLLRGDQQVARETYGANPSLASRFISGDDGTLTEPIPASAIPDSPSALPDRKPVGISSDTTKKVFDSSGWSSTGKLRNTYYLRAATLALQVADALAYAHHNGILHRDIKPANLLLDTEGIVWVTDFGLAKTAKDDLTRTGDVVGTLRYMAPERFRGQTDHRCDIYSLGLTLYELCTLQPAFTATDRAHLVQQITEHDPPAPRKLDPSIPRDLETIILKTIDRNPAKRYRSAQSLGEDLQAFLDDRPIHARRISLPERVWRVCRRNPVTAVMTALVLALLVFSAIGSSLFALRLNQTSKELRAENKRATSHLAVTEKAIDRLLRRVAKFKGQPEMEEFREEMLQEALQLQQQVLAMEQEDSGIRAKAVQAHRWMAEIEDMLGRDQEALKSVQRALELADSLPDASAKLQRGLGHTAHAKMLSKRARWDEARKASEQAIDNLEHPQAPDRETRRLLALAAAYHQLGVTEEHQGNLTKSEQALNQALSLLAAPPNEPHHLAEYLAIKCDASNSLAIVYRSKGNLDDAEQLYRTTIEIAEQIIAMDGSDKTESLDRIGKATMNLGNLMITRRDRVQAMEAYRRSHETYEQLSADFPRRVEFRELATRTLLNLGIAYPPERIDEAVAAYEGAIQQGRAFIDQFGVTNITLDTVGIALNNLANIHKDRDELDKASALLEQAIQIRRDAMRDNTAGPAFVKSLAVALGNLSNVLILQGNLEEANERCREAFELIAPLLRRTPGNRTAQTVCVSVTERLCFLAATQNDPAAVANWTAQALELLPDTPKSGLRLASKLGTTVKGLNEEREQTTADILAEQAIELISAAIAQGWVPEEPLEEIKSFQSLRSYEGFSALHAKASLE